jgi:DNA-binding PadR family transcriptional regulator
MARNKKLPLTETTYYVLLALLKPAHGYVIMQEVEELSKGTVKMAAGTMYGAIENLLKLKYIKQIDSEDSRRKVYTITDEGKSILKQQFERYEHMIQITKARLDGDDSE